MTDTRPIGVFDSGVGGLSVVAELRKLLPAESVLYFADTLHCPYGSRPFEEIRALSIEASRYLLAQGAKLIVVACNTASSVALAALRAAYGVPFVGMVPAIKPASLSTKARKVMVMGTATTVATQVFDELVKQFAAGIEIYAQPCPGLVELVEEGKTSLRDAGPLLREYLAPVTARGIDTVVLGCTHFVFVRDAIRQLVGEDVRVLDTGRAVALQTQRVLRRHALEALPSAHGKIILSCSGEREVFLASAHKLLDQ
jgi:glutamate racemase